MNEGVIFHIQSGNIKKLAHFITPDNVNQIIDKKEGWTSLHAAAYYEDVRSVRYLLSIGANPDALDNLGMTPLYLGISCMLKERYMQQKVYMSHQQEIIDLLISKTNINLIANNGKSLLAYSGEISVPYYVVEHFLRAGADIYQLDEPSMSIERTVFYMVKPLIQEISLQLRLGRRDGNSYLSYCPREILEMLIQCIRATWRDKEWRKLK